MLLAHLEQEQLAEWLSPQLRDSAQVPVAQHPPGMAHSVVALTGAGLQQKWSRGEGESGVRKNAFGQQGWAGGSKEMMERKQ